MDENRVRKAVNALGWYVSYQKKIKPAVILGFLFGFLYLLFQVSFFLIAAIILMSLGGYSYILYRLHLYRYNRIYPPELRPVEPKKVDNSWKYSFQSSNQKFRLNFEFNNIDYKIELVSRDSKAHEDPDILLVNQSIHIHSSTIYKYIQTKTCSCYFENSEELREALQSAESICFSNYDDSGLCHPVRSETKQYNVLAKYLSPKMHLIKHNGRLYLTVEDLYTYEGDLAPVLLVQIDKDLFCKETAIYDSNEEQWVEVFA